MTERASDAPGETYNPWSVVNLVFHHLADGGLHPVLGESGDPNKAASDLLIAMGITPAPDHAGPADPDVQNDLAALRKKYMPDVEE